MINGKSVLAIIPARGGSKEIVGKNKKLFGKKPLIAWTIEEAKKSDYIDNIIVSTDSNEIADIAIKYGAKAPFLRPRKYAKNKSTAKEVILHALNWFEKNSNTFDYFVYLQPTSPFRKTIHIDESIKQLCSQTIASSIVSVRKVKDHPYWMKIIAKKGYLKNYTDDSDSYSNRQQLPKFYTVNGAIYISTWKVFIKDESFYKKKCLAYLMEETSSHDLDTMTDWHYAEYILSRVKV